MNGHEKYSQNNFRLIRYVGLISIYFKDKNNCKTNAIKKNAIIFVITAISLNSQNMLLSFNWFIILINLRKLLLIFYLCCKDENCLQPFSTTKLKIIYSVCDGRWRQLRRKLLSFVCLNPSSNEYRILYL